MAGIIVLFPKIEDAKNIRAVLVKSGYEVNAICTSGAQALSQAYQLGGGIVVCGSRFPDMMYGEVRENLPAGFDMLLIAGPTVLSEVVNREIVCLPMPIRKSDLLNTLEMMVAAQFRRQKKRTKKGPERSLREKKLIEDAKKVLMDRNHMTEEEAHRYLQKCSMESGTNILETAQMVFCLNSY